MRRRRFSLQKKTYEIETIALAGRQVLREIVFTRESNFK